MDRIGNVIARPVRHDIRKAIASYLETWGILDDSVYIQSNVEDTLREVFCLKYAQIQDLYHGWDFNILMDSWTFLSMYGYDAHESIEVTSNSARVNSN